MPEQSQTPASRRFLPVASSSKAQRSASVRKVPFAHPSQPTSSSPFLRTPLSLPKARQDEIETSFEDDAQSPAAHDQYRIQKTYQKGNDLIEDNPHDGGSDHETGGSGLFEVSGYRNTDGNSKLVDTNAVESQRANFSSPLAKRQKTSHFRQVSTKSIEVSSSPPSKGDVDFLDTESTTHLEGHEALPQDDLRSDETRASDEDGTTTRRLQLKPRPENAMHGEPERQAARKAFKGLSAGSTPWMDNPLPATFSPSKRKGKHEYSYGGAADTVRSWILDVANEQSKITTTSDNHVADLETIYKDNSGRFEVARDGKSQDWLLVRQDDQTETAKTAKGRGPEGIRSIVVKGKGTTWDLHRDQSLRDRNSPNNLRVAVLWNNDPAQ